MARRAQQDDEVVQSLKALCAALDENAKSADLIRKRAKVIIEARAQGKSYTEIIEGGTPPLVPELVSEKLQRLFDAGSRVRRSEAAALHAEGVSMERIGEIFGVTRQRVSTLLKPRSADEAASRI